MPGDRGQERSHGPEGEATRTWPPPARRRRGPGTGAGNLAYRRARSPAGGRPPGRCCCPTTRSWGYTRRPTGSPGTSGGTSRRPARISTRCCCISRTSSCTASRWASRLNWCWPCSFGRMRSAASRRPGTSPITEGLTVRDSSLSASSQAVQAAEAGHLGLACDYLAEAALIDLDDLPHNTRDGLHIAALAGSWIALVAGLGGMRHRPDALHFAPRLPPALTRLAFAIVTGGRRLRAEATGQAVTCTLSGDGPPVQISHHGQPVTLAAGRPQTRLIPVLADRPQPAQP